MTNPKTIIIPEGKICDYIDGKFRNDTPEEYVRQNIEKRLVNEHKYKVDRIAVEYTLRVGSHKPRADIVIFSDENVERSQENIHIIIETKSEKIEPTAKKDGVEQLKSYMAACLNCEWGLWTNRKHKEVLRKVATPKGKFKFIEGYNDIPSEDGDIDEIERPTRDNLKRAVEDNLLFAFKRCHNFIHTTDGLKKEDAFFEFLKVIFCKTEDEKQWGEKLDFYAKSNEKLSPDGQLTVQKRIEKIFNRVKRKYTKIFSMKDQINIQPSSLAHIVSELQSYSLLNTHIDIKGKAYEEIVGANLRGDRGEFFTPRNVVKMIVKMLNIGMDEKVLDSSCGTGGFLVIAMNEIIEKLEANMTKELKKSKNKFTSEERQSLTNRGSEIACNNFFGFDIGLHLVKATKMNMVMNNDGSGNILRCNSLHPPHEWNLDFKQKLAEKLGINIEDIRNYHSIDFFDVIITNPPFGSKLPIREPHILEQYELARIWQKDKTDKNNWIMTERLKSSVPPEQLFIERCIQFLRPGGRIGIVLPDAILGSPGLGYIRQWLIKNTRIIASIDLHVDTFQPSNGTQTSALFLQKKTEEEVRKEEKTGKTRDYPIFMAMVDRVGHDKRGNKVFKRDKHGNIILEDSPITLGTTAEGQQTVQAQAKERVIDDQTETVVEVFEKWREREGIIW